MYFDIRRQIRNGKILYMSMKGYKSDQFDLTN